MIEMNKKETAKIEMALKNASKEISMHASQGKVAASLASEGYAGGYRDALQDVLSLARGVSPSRREFWE